MSLKTTDTDVAAAIAAAIAAAAIVTITVDTKGEALAICYELEDAAVDADLESDSVDTGGLIEVWAYDPESDDDSMIWRVHVQYG